MSAEPCIVREALTFLRVGEFRSLERLLVRVHESLCSHAGRGGLFLHPPTRVSKPSNPIESCVYMRIFGTAFKTVVVVDRQTENRGKIRAARLVVLFPDREHRSSVVDFRTESSSPLAVHRNGNRRDCLLH